MTTTIHDLLEEFREAASSNRDLGDRFERLMVTYFPNDPLYKSRFSNVWLWMDWPKRGTQSDTGIDIVAAEAATGKYCAIQCKFYSPNTVLDKHHIDSFFTASGTSWFSSRIIVSTTDRWNKHAEKALENQQIPVQRLRVEDLAESTIDWSSFSFQHPQQLQLKPKKTLRDHQREALKDVMAGFEKSDRGKLLMACGTGKTFTSLKIAEEFAPNAQVLLLVPSISLLSQTLREWTAEAGVSLHNIAVCSDTKVAKRKRNNDDNSDLTTQDLPIPVTTDGQKIADVVQNFSGKRDLTVIYSTYQSIQAIADAQAKGLPEFDLIICDEAHRTTGATISGECDSF